MKKSNIVLLSAFILVIVGLTISIVYVKTVFFKNIIRGDGFMIEEVREITPFTEINVKDGVQVFFIQDTVFSVKLMADSNIIEHINTYVEYGELKIYLSKRVIAKNLKAYVSGDNLENIRISAGSKFVAEEPVEFDDIQLYAGAGAQLNIDGTFNLVELVLSAGSIANMSGECDVFIVSSNAGSILNAKELASNETDINATSGSVINVNAKKSINVNASSGSVVSYWGNPEQQEINTRSGSSVHKK